MLSSTPESTTGTTVKVVLISCSPQSIRHPAAWVRIMYAAGCAKSPPSRSAGACGLSSWREADRPTAQPRGDGARSRGSRAQYVPRLRPLPLISTGQAGTVRKRRLNICTPCSHHGAQAVTQKSQSRTQLVFDPPRRLFYLPGDFRFCEALKYGQFE